MKEYEPLSDEKKKDVDELAKNFERTLGSNEPINKEKK